MSTPASQPYDAPAPPVTMTIAAIYAHPDDGEFFAGGTLAKWARSGHTIYAICATDGAAGARRDDLPAAEVAATRLRELTEALRVIGGQPPVMLNFPDAFLRD